MDNRKEFKIKIFRFGKFGESTAAVIELPVTWAEYQDVKERARITDDRTIYSTELLEIKREYLKQYILQA